MDDEYGSMSVAIVVYSADCNGSGNSGSNKAPQPHPVRHDAMELNQGNRGSMVTATTAPSAQDYDLQISDNLKRFSKSTQHVIKILADCLKVLESKSHRLA